MVDPFGKGAPSGRRPSFRGNLMMDMSAGELRARAWPKKRKTRRTPEQLQREQTFGMTQKAWNYYFPAGRAWMEKASEGTPMLPRDIFTMMIYNRLFSFILEDGKVAYPMPAKLDVEAALDAITQTPGEVLQKTPSGWTGTTISSGATFFPVNSPDPAQFTVPVAGGTAGVDLIQRSYGFDMRRNDFGVFGSMRIASRMQAAPTGPFTAVLGARLTPVGGGGEFARQGLAVSDGTQVIAAVFDASAFSRQLASTWANSLTNEVNYLNAVNCLGPVDVLFRIQVTSTQIITSFSIDGGDTYFAPTARDISSTFTPTLVGPCINSFNNVQPALTLLTAFYFEVA